MSPAYAEPQPSDRFQFAVFAFDDAPVMPFSDGMAAAEVVSDELVAAFQKHIDAGVSDGGIGKTLFSYGDESEGVCLLYAWFKPNFVIPRHKHGQDCLYFVVSGEAILGSRTMRAGDGFYVPKDTPYAYVAGPRGVEVLEYRTCIPSQQTGEFLETRPDRWEKFVGVVVENRDAWRAETVPPSQRQRVDDDAGSAV